jgi:hypothetical protein
VNSFLNGQHRLIFNSINLGRHLAVESLVGAFEFLEVEVTSQTCSRLAGRSIIVELHLLVFHRTPQAFGKDIVRCPTATIHADMDAGGGKALEILWAGEKLIFQLYGRYDLTYV